MLASVEALLNYLREDHGVTICHQIADLLAQKEITSDLLYASLIPDTLLTCVDDTTGEPLALQLKSSEKGSGGYTLHYEGLDATTSAEGFGRVKCTGHVARFNGVVKIHTLPIYPMRYHSDEGSLRRALLIR